MSEESTVNQVDVVETKAAPTSPTISFADFQKIDIRVAQIESVSDVPKSNKLYCLQVNLGPELGTRQILSGIKNCYTVEQLLGRKILVICNLATAKLMGMESQGMLLAADCADPNACSLLQCDQDLAPGSKVH